MKLSTGLRVAYGLVQLAILVDAAPSGSLPASSLSSAVSSALPSATPSLSSVLTSLSSAAPSSVASSASVSSAPPSSVSASLSTILSSAASSASASLSTASASVSSALSSAPTSAASSLISSTSALSSVPTSFSASSAASANATLSTSFISAPTGSPTFNTGTGTETGIITIPISPVSFTPFPVPTDTPVSGVFVETEPSNPPAPHQAPGLGGPVPDFGRAWSSAKSKATAELTSWSLEEKVNLTTGVGWMGGRCVGNIPAIAGKFPGLCLEDSPLGVRFADFVTAFPTGISAAATWNRTLIRLRGLFMGREHKGKGVNVALGPMMNLGRVAQGGRNWEGFGADPFLSGEAAYETILGMQEGGVQACAKHYINNEQEHKRTQESSNVDDRTQHELYAHPFMRSVMAGVASVMCSYNLVNDTYACENDKMLNDVMKREFGFQGYIMSDWSAQHSTMSAVAGLDMTMPGDITFNSGTSWFGQNLTDFVNNGTIAASRVDDMATRILASWFLLHQDDSDYPTTNFNAFFPLDEATNSHLDVQEDHFKVVREIGAAGSVLLKNEGALPLLKPRSIAIIGNDSGPSIYGPNGFSDRQGDDGVLAMGWGSGTAQFPYLIDPLSAIQNRAIKDHTLVTWWRSNFDLPGVAATVQQQSAAIVFVNADSGEDYITVDGNEGDRKNLTLWQNADALITTVANNNNNTIVVVHSVGPAIVEPWIDHPNVTALIWAGIPGQEAGNSIRDVLYGDYNPSGRLPYTIAKSPSDYPTQLITGGGPNDILSIPYTEGLFIDYRHFDANNIEPRFEFGFGLSYTTFKYSNLWTTIIPQHDPTSSALEAAWLAGKATPIAEGSTTALWLHRPLVQVTFDVQNTGPVTGSEIPQLYIHHPASAGEPPSLLKGFTDVRLHKGQKTTVTLTLSRYDLSFWDTVAQGWVKPQGKITFSVGASSRDFRLAGTIPL
ncbi:glycoside hydrolase family 3 protein [Phanerochaete sordida]|uniref:beta-glucosidase n=1 Tax=Phanerochaete sordida TaxID=48140 RepID=A0A9P3FXZ5_9APHY|nr:glycoside hydrolase family 3 protein [Phanerochaete sordida]